MNIPSDTCLPSAQAGKAPFWCASGKKANTYLNSEHQRKLPYL